ncbi:ATP phosphoribosyltransferase [Roseiflexus sp.]|uniref:ATP phosphoribosyltransferase n=1 Tax=Roseiflexus sp. TaxID=2562120 RepID=UPI00398A9591
MTLRFAIPSKGSLYDGTIAFLESAGLRVSRPNPRRYTASIRALPGADILLHRPTDIVEKVAAGEIDLGISGLDLVEELRGDRDDLIVLFDDLGYGAAELVVAVPETWIDVTSWHDLADLAVELHSQGRPLRIATKYPSLTRRFCYANGINYFRLIESQGATEAAPGLGYADIIVDITETGVTLRDNQLKIIGDPILRTQACLIASRRCLRTNAAALAATRTVLELVEARRRARRFVQVTANIAGESAEDVGRRVAARPDLAGVQGPTIALVWPSTPRAAGASGWYMVTLLVPQDRVLDLVAHLRQLGGDTIAVMPAQYVFDATCSSYDRLIALLEEHPYDHSDLR